MGGRDFVAWITAQLTDHLGRGRAYAAYNKRYGAKFGELPINYRRRLIRVLANGGPMQRKAYATARGGHRAGPKMYRLLS